MRRLLVVLVLLSELAVACGGGDAESGSIVQPRQLEPPSWSAVPTGLPCGRLSTAPATTRVGRYVVSELATLPYDPPVEGGQAWDHYLAFTTDHNKAMVCDLDSGLVATIAEAPTGGPGLVQRPVGSKDVVVYTRLSRVANLESSGWTGWAIEAVDLRTGRRWSIDRSENREAVDTEYGNLPLPQIDWPWITWLRAKDKTGSQLWSFDLRSGERRVVATLPTGGRIDLADGLVVYDHVTSSDYRQRDLYSVPADGSRTPTRLFELPGGQWPKSSSNWVTWDHKVGSAAPPATMAQYESWAYSLAGGGAPILLGPGSGPQPGRDFVLASKDRGLVLYDPTRPTEAPASFVAGNRLVPYASSARVWQDLVVWTVSDMRKKTGTLHLVRVRAT